MPVLSFSHEESEVQRRRLAVVTQVDQQTPPELAHSGPFPVCTAPCGEFPSEHDTCVPHASDSPRGFQGSRALNLTAACGAIT